MYETIGYTLTIPRGDTAELEIQLIDEEQGAAYILSANELVRFDLFSMRSVQPIFSRSAGSEAQKSDGTVKIMLRSQDTLQFNGTYKYMVRVINTETETVDTIIGLENDAYCNIK